MLLAICTTQVKEGIKKKKNQKIKFAPRGFEPGSSEYARTKNERFYPLRGIYSFSVVIESFQG